MLRHAFPLALREDLNEVLNVMPGNTVRGGSIVTGDERIPYSLEIQRVEIPYRMYLPELEEAEYKKLSQTQKQILCCIYTRSCNGFVREKYLRRLLDLPWEQWAIPFIVKLCDEYVLEILEVIYGKLKERDNTDIQKFCRENKAAIRKGYARMISYWDAYYRGHEGNIKKYIGRVLFRECFGYNRTFER